MSRLHLATGPLRPPAPRTGGVPFIHKGAAVHRGPRHEAQATSSTMARRIANALNRYQPGPKGY